MKITDELLDFYIDKKVNVLLRGEKGCGKSTMVLDAIKRNNKKFRYFSAATMDPWVDFIGIPKERTEMVNGVMVSYLDLVKPKEFAEDDVQIIVLDEFNRSRPKVRNAVLELIQMKSINGRVFKNLESVWAMINPEDEAHTYVETLDPAQIDRFQICLDVEYKPDLTYFKNKFGADMAKSALEWWQELTPDQKKIVSPRRLDYALEHHQVGGDMRHVVGNKVNVSALINVLDTGSSLTKLKAYVKNKDVEGARLHLRNENNYNTALPYILKDKKLLSFFVPVMDEEKVMSLLGSNEAIKKMVFENPGDFLGTLEPLYRQDDTEISALAKQAVITKCPELQRPDYPLGAPLIKSTNIKTILNPSKSCDDLVKELVRFIPGAKSQTADKFFAAFDSSKVSLPSKVEVKMLYDTLLGFSPLVQTNDSARSLVDLAVLISEKSTAADIGKDMVELNGLFNWGLLHLHVYALAHPEHVRVETAYQKSVLKPEDSAFVMKTTPARV